MFRVMIDSITDFKRFLSSIDTEWVTIILTVDNSLFIENSSEMFAVYQAKTEASAGEKSRLFRFEKDILNLISLQGVMEFKVTDDSVTCTISNSTQGREVTVPLHQAFVSAFQEKLNIINSSSATAFDATVLKTIVNVSKSLHSFLEVEDGIAGVIARDGTQIYKEVKGVDNLCLSASAATALYKCDHHWFCSGRYVYALSGCFGLLVTQSRGSGIWDYDVIKEDTSGAAMIANIDIEDLLLVLQRLSKSSLEFDYRHDKFILTDSPTVYKIAVPVVEKRISEKYNKESIPMNVSVFLNIVAKLGSSIKLVIKKNFMQIYVGDCIIVCK